MMFEITSSPIDVHAARSRVLNPSAGGFCSFEGWVRDHQEGRSVLGLEYESYTPLAVKEGQRIIQEAIERFEILQAVCVHRVGSLVIGELALWEKTGGRSGLYRRDSLDRSGGDATGADVSDTVTNVVES